MRSFDCPNCGYDCKRLYVADNPESLTFRDCLSPVMCAACLSKAKIAARLRPSADSKSGAGGA